jgi:hypothetical protein
MGLWAYFVVLLGLCGSVLDASIHKSMPTQRILPVRAPEVTEPCVEECEVFPENCSKKPLDVAEALEPIGISLYAAYTYWYAGIEGLDLGRSGQFFPFDDPSFDFNNSLLEQPFHYQSGFQVGAFWEKEHWTLEGKYTWVVNTTNQSSLAPAPFATTDGSIWVWEVTPWLLQPAEDGGSISSTQVSSKWHLAMSVADLTAGYGFPEMGRLRLTPYVGLRGAWISQKLEMDCVTAAPIVHYPKTVHAITASHGRGIGPKFGVSGGIDLGVGFILQGNVAGSFLWMQYPKITHVENLASFSDPRFFKAEIRTLSALRPVVDCSLGVGWQRFLFDGQYKIAFSADYDFMLWWNQNVMRQMMSEFWNRTSSSGDLYLHGLTISGEFEF